MTGIELIAAERQRQIEVEGWTPEHDDAHTHGQLIQAAVSYADCNQIMAKRQESFVLENVRGDCTIYSKPWPWEHRWWKRSKDPVRNLVKAGALIAAEIDRLQRIRDSNEAVAGEGKDA